MKRHENKQDEELQRKIEEQEEAMSALLLRVMDRPLVPLHKTLDGLKQLLDDVQQANARAADAVEASLGETLEGQGKRMNRQFGELADGIGSLKEALDKHHTGQAERDARMHENLLQADATLAQLDAKSDAAVTAIADNARGLARANEALGTVHAQQQALADQLGHELGGLGQRMEERHAQIDDGLGKTAAMLEQLDSKANAAGDSLAAAAGAVAKVDAGLGAMREQELAAAGQLNRELNGLAQQLERQQLQVCERIDTLQPGLASQFESLAAAITGSAREVARQYEALPEAQQALVAAAVQQQLAVQLAPIQARTKWLFAVCGLSFASTLALLGMQLFR